MDTYVTVNLNIRRHRDIRERNVFRNRLWAWWGLGGDQLPSDDVHHLRIYGASFGFLLPFEE